MRNKTLKAIVAIAMMLIGWLPSLAYSFQVDGIFYDKLGISEVAVTSSNSSSNKYSGNVVIPSSVKYNGVTYSVISIGDLAFNSCSSLTSIQIPNSVTSIGNYAFSNCSRLTDVVIGNSVTSIGNNAFHNCESLTNVIWNVIKCSDFYSNDIPFENCPNITSFTFGDKVEYIPACLCYGMNKLTSIEIPNSVTSIGDGAFQSCESLTGIEIPNSVTRIGDGAFKYCSNLTSIEIPNSVTSIGEFTFYCCDSLTSIEIPNSVTSIGGYAFAFCESLTKITCLATNPPTIKSDTFLIYSAELYVPAGCKSAYQSANHWKKFYSIKEIPTLSTSIALNQTTATLEVTETITLIATILPENATDKSVEWSSSDESVATIDANGLVTAVAVGEAIITVTTVDGSNLSATCKITVSKNETLAESITLNKTTASLKVAETLTLIATVLPSNTTNKSVTWKSSNTSVATVNANGVVTAVKAGEATITATTTDGSNKSATCKITVTKNETLAESITLNKTTASLKVAETLTLIATVLPSNTTNKSVTWKSSNISVATVNANGVVTAVKAGEATIKVTTNDGSNLSASCKIIVSKSESGDESGDKVPVELEGVYNAFANSGFQDYPDEEWQVNITIDKSEKGKVWIQPICMFGGLDAEDISPVYAIYDATDNTLIMPLGQVVYESSNYKMVIAQTTNGSDKNLTGNVVMQIDNNESGVNITFASDYIIGAGDILNDDWWYQALYNVSYSKTTAGEELATSISLNKTEVSLEATETIMLTATILPETATNKSVTWKSSNEAVATVDANGKVTAVAVGEATITATTKDGSNKSATCKITVAKTLAESVTLDKTSATLKATETLTLKATVAPATTTNKSVTWKSSNEAVATVDANGKVTAVAVGEATITATTKDGSNKSATCKITVAKTLAESVTLDKTSATLKATETLTLKATVTPTTTTNKAVTWKSSNEAVATVDGNGKVTAVAVGEATITATTADGTNKSATCKITVAKTLATSISLDKTSATLKATETLTLKATVLPSNTTNKSVTWKSSNTSVATVNANGVVTAVKAGEATITATTTDGSNKSATCKITVTKNEVYHEVGTKFSVNGLNYIITVKGQEVSLAKSEANNEYRGDIAIPSSVKYDGITYSVTSIGKSAFSDCESLKSIEIPNSVTSIGNYAFSDCESLKSIEIPNSVTSIGNYAFEYCTSLTSIEIPNSVTSIGNFAFNSCYDLTSIEIPNSVTSIGQAAFSYCESLTSIVVDAGNSIYDSRNGCNAIIKTASNTLIAGCQNTIIPNSVTSIGDHAFTGCDSLTSIEIPNSVTSIGDWAFGGCSSLTSIQIPNSVTSIGDYAFYWCDSLTSIEIPNSVKSIGESAFSVCSSLNSIEIPNSVTSIGDHAFKYCSNLTKITCHATTPPTIKSDTFNSYSAELYVPAGCISVYQSANYWKNFNIKEIPTLSTYIALNKTSASLKVTETLTLVATVLPENATNKSVIWKSSNEAVAVVDENGVVTAVGVGEAIITATTVDGSNLSATCKVTVVPTLAESITLDKTEISLEATEIATLVATVLPELTTNKSVTWTSSNEEVATVDENGVVTAITVGEATIIATTNDGSNLSATCKVIVEPTIAESIILDKTEISLKAEESVALIATILPESTTDKSVIWMSSDESVATVNENGVVTAIAVGEATITATTNDGSNLSASCKVTIPTLAVSIEVTPNEVEAEENSEVQLSVNILPENTTYKSVEWSSSNDAIASVNANGLVKIRKEGNVVITATTTDGSNLSATCKVTVIPTLATSIELDKTEISLEATETATLVATVLPELTTNKSVTWTSSNEAVATVDANGVVTAIAVGEATITAIATDGSGATATCQVTVIPTLAMSIELDKTEVSAEEKSDLQLTATILPEHTTNKEVAWSSSYKWVAKVDNTGLVTMYSAGEVIITATTTDGSNLSATCRINVYSGIDGVNGNDVIVATIGDNIVVKNAKLGSVVNVYSSNGALIKSMTATDGSIVIEAPVKGIYVVAIDGKSFKVMVK